MSDEAAIAALVDRFLAAYNAGDWATVWSFAWWPAPGDRTADGTMIARVRLNRVGDVDGQTWDEVFERLFFEGVIPPPEFRAIAPTSRTVQVIDLATAPVTNLANDPSVRDQPLPYQAVGFARLRFPFRQGEMVCHINCTRTDGAWRYGGAQFSTHGFVPPPAPPRESQPALTAAELAEVTDLTNRFFAAYNAGDWAAARAFAPGLAPPPEEGVGVARSRLFGVNDPVGPEWQLAFEGLLYDNVAPGPEFQHIAVTRLNVIDVRAPVSQPPTALAQVRFPVPQGMIDGALTWQQHANGWEIRGYTFGLAGPRPTTR